MTGVSFRRTEAWHGGWRGKLSSTPVLLDGETVGEIAGHEDAAISGVMHYTLTLPGVRESADSLRAAKARARELLA
jgi:hypothetical protein